MWQTFLEPSEAVACLVAELYSSPLLLTSLFCTLFTASGQLWEEAVHMPPSRLVLLKLLAMLMRLMAW